MKYESHEENIRSLSSLYDNVPFIFTYKNLSHEFLYCNQFLLNYMGCKSQRDVIGKTDFDFRWEPFADIYMKHEKDALKQNMYVALVPICDSFGVIDLECVHRMPCKDSKGNIVGLLIHAYLLKNKIPFELSNLLTKKKDKSDMNIYTIDKKRFDMNLSLKEQECLFYFIRGKTCKIIGQILGISFRTVEMHIVNIKQKFGCHTKSELIDTAINQGYLYDIPASLLDKRIKETSAR